MANLKNLSPSSELLLVTLTWQLRLVAEKMVTAPEYLRCRAVSPRQLRALEQQRWLHRGRVAAAVPELDGELVAWRPREEQPEFGGLSWTLKERCRGWKPVSLPVCWSTEQAVTVFGGVGGRIRQPLQVQHDVGVAAMYFSRASFAISSRAAWVGEDLIRKLKPDIGSKVPDALLIGSELQPIRAIEFGGSYSLERLQRFHDFCASQQLPYEIW